MVLHKSLVSILIGFKERLELEMGKLLCVGETCNELQTKELKFQVIPEYLKQYKDKSMLMGYLGGVVVGKVFILISWCLAVEGMGSLGKRIIILEDQGFINHPFNKGSISIWTT